MARFRATIQGQRGEASRLGNEKNGIQASVNGWNSGVKVYGSVNEDGQDVFAIYATGGSNGRNAEIYLGKVLVVDGIVSFKGE